MNHHQIEAQRVFKLPVNIPLYKIVALIMQKVRYNQFPTDNTYIDSCNHLIFENLNNIGRRISVDVFGGSGIGIGGDYIPIYTFSLYNHESFIIELKPVEVFKIDSTTVTKYSSYLNHVINDVDFTVSSRLKTSIIYNNEKNERYIRNENGLLTNLKMFEMSKKTIIPLLRGIQDFNWSKHGVVLNISQFGKLKNHFEFLDNGNFGLPTQDTRIDFIETIKMIKQSTLTDFKCGPISIKKETCKQVSTVTIKFLGIILARETSFAKFQFLNHPGINFVCLMMDRLKKLDKFNITAEEEMFKTV